MTRTKLYQRFLSLLLILLILSTTFATAASAAIADPISPMDLFTSTQVSYINNKYEGTYIKNSSNSLAMEGGLISSLGNTIRWTITPLGNNVYTIRSVSNPDLYLAAGTYSSSSAVNFVELDDSTIPDRFRWTITSALGGGCLIRNVFTEKYLYAYNSQLKSSSSLGNSGTSTYYRRAWRIVATDYYGPGSSYTRMELPSSHEFKTIYMLPGETKTPSLTQSYSNVLWKDATDFKFTGFDTDYVTLDANNRFVANSSSSFYSTTITATHKPTGVETQFLLVIKPKVVKVAIAANGHDHSTCLSEISSYVTACQYTNYTSADELSTAQMDQLLDNDQNRVFVSRSHAGQQTSGGTVISTHLLINNTSVESEKIRYRSTGTIASLDLSNMKLILFVGCKTGAEGEGGPNLPSVAVASGATTAIGFSVTIDCGNANGWTEDFFECLAGGATVEEALEALCGEKGKYEGKDVGNYVICGSRSTKLN